MFPSVFEWQWDATHLVFFGGLGLALTILGAGVGYCVVKAFYDTYKE